MRLCRKTWTSSGYRFCRARTTRCIRIMDLLKQNKMDDVLVLVGGVVQYRILQR